MPNLGKKVELVKQVLKLFSTRCPAPKMNRLYKPQQLEKRGIFFFYCSRSWSRTGLQLFCCCFIGKNWLQAAHLGSIVVLQNIAGSCYLMVFLSLISLGSSATNQHIDRLKHQGCIQTDVSAALSKGRDPCVHSHDTTVLMQFQVFANSWLKHHQAPCWTCKCTFPQS